MGGRLRRYYPSQMPYPAQDLRRRPADLDRPDCRVDIRRDRPGARHLEDAAPGNAFEHLDLTQPGVYMHQTRSEGGTIAVGLGEDVGNQMGVPADLNRALETRRGKPIERLRSTNSLAMAGKACWRPGQDGLSGRAHRLSARYRQAARSHFCHATRVWLS